MCGIDSQYKVLMYQRFEELRMKICFDVQLLCSGVKMDILNMSINDMIKICRIWIGNNKDLLSFLFGGCDIGIVAWILKKWKLAKTKIKDLVCDVREKGLYNYNDIIKKLGIQKIIDSDFPEYSDYLFVQYGSSVDSNNIKSNDYDFIVLLLGHPKDNVKHVHNKGSYPMQQENTSSTNVDIVFRDYLSFLFAASSGMPYENSIITNSKLLYGHRGYYKWLKNITMNIMMDKEFLVRRFDEKILNERQTYKNEKRYHPSSKYDIVRAGYYYITSMIQKEIILNLPKVILQDDIVPLADVQAIGTEYFKDDKLKRKYMKLINWLKRIDENEIDISEIDEVIDYMDKKRGRKMRTQKIPKISVCFNQPIFSERIIESNFYSELQKNGWCEIIDDVPDKLSKWVNFNLRKAPK